MARRSRRSVEGIKAEHTWARNNRSSRYQRNTEEGTRKENSSKWSRKARTERKIIVISSRGRKKGLELEERRAKSECTLLSNG